MIHVNATIQSLELNTSFALNVCMQKVNDIILKYNYIDNFCTLKYDIRLPVPILRTLYGTALVSC